MAFLPTGISLHSRWQSLTAVMHHTAEALSTGQAVDGCLPPDAPEPKIQRYGKFGVPIDE